MQGNEILSDEMLDTLVAQDGDDRADRHVSLNALAGSTKLGTIQFKALVGNQVMLLFLDSGSSHSFVDQAMVKKLHCPVTTISPLKIKVANGQYMYCDKMVSSMQWWLQGHTFEHDMRVLPLGGYDGILGIDWLARWGLMNCQCEQKWISFPYKQKEVKLVGLPDVQPLDLQMVSVEELVKSFKGNDIWAVAELSTINEEVQVSVGIPVAVQQLLSEYADIFQEPTELPPQRELDHAIHLLPDAAPVNCRPYRYSPLQKDDIERQVREMLKSGTIIPSVSPFSSPVLLVKKKDGSWWFCIDYRRLNAITVKSKFPIPIVDELLDELVGTTVFSKLDLRAGYHQIRMVPQDELKTAFKTHNGQYQFRVMPFGLTNAPATFQCVMNSAFAPFVRKFVLVFMDDILVYSKSLSEHVQHLYQVFQVLREQ
jgi:hypothetical protein